MHVCVPPSLKMWATPFHPLILHLCSCVAINPARNYVVCFTRHDDNFTCHRFSRSTTTVTALPWHCKNWMISRALSIPMIFVSIWVQINHMPYQQFAQINQHQWYPFLHLSLTLWQAPSTFCSNTSKQVIIINIWF